MDRIKATVNQELSKQRRCEMRLQANDIHSRIRMARLLEKMDENPEYGRSIGVEDSSHFRREADAMENREKEVQIC